MSDFQKNNSPENIAAQNPPASVQLPTVGRIVLMYGFNAEPVPAVVSQVDGSYTIVSLCAFTPAPFVAFGVAHVQEIKPGDFYWDWMPYQKGQAAKTEMLEAQLAAPITSYDHDKRDSKG